MLLSRDEYIERMSAIGIEVGLGAPIWAHEYHHNYRSEWFVKLHIADFLEMIRTLEKQGVVCYSAEGMGPDGLMESWWGTHDHAVAMELWMRWG